MEIINKKVNDLIDYDLIKEIVKKEKKEMILCQQEDLKKR